MNVPAKLLTFSGFCVAVFLLLSSCTTTSTAEAVQNEFRAVSKAVLPTIVKIDVVEIAKDKAPNATESRPFFDYFFDDPDGNRPNREFHQESLGSGIIVRRVGDKIYVLTNAHVITDAQDITVTLDDQRVFPGEIVGRDERKDLALVSFKSPDTSIVPAVLGDSDALGVGDWVLAMGSPYGFQSTVTVGIVSALHRRGGPGGNINDFIQTDASINKGNSGGALVDIQGRIIGINTWITSESGDSVGLGFSIPINNVKHAITDFIETGKIQYGWLGVSMVSLDADSAQSLGVSGSQGALLSGVYQSSPADKAGLRPGDVILAINGKKVSGADDMIQYVGELSVGEEPQLTVLRGSERSIIAPHIALREGDETLAKQSALLWPGYAVYPLIDSLRKDLSVADDVKGLIVRQIIVQSPAAKAGLRNRDIIKTIGGTPVQTIQDFYRILNAADRNAAQVLVVVRDGKELSLEIKPSAEKQQAGS